MEASSKKFLAFVFLFIVSVLYGASYQQFRHFDIDDVRGLSDSRDYVRMSRGDYSVHKVRRYRFAVPFLSSQVRKALSPFLEESSGETGRGLSNERQKELDKLSFYAVNFFFVSCAGLVLFLVLSELKFNAYLSLIGVAIFLTGRVTVTSAATPTVDSLFFFAVALIFYLALTDRLLLLAVLNPLLVLSKEPVLVIMLLPFLKKKRTLILAVSFIVSLAVLLLSREYIMGLVPDLAPEISSPREFFDVVRVHFYKIPGSAAGILAPKALHSLLSGYSIFLVFSIAGFYINFRSKRYEIPGWLLLMAPLSLIFALMSRNYGRMFFTSFAVMIPLALIFIEYVISPDSFKKPDDGGRTDAEEPDELSRSL
jgi:hypothetical protein